MALNEIAILSPMKILKNTDIVRKLYADDGTAEGQLKNLHKKRTASQNFKTKTVSENKKLISKLSQHAEATLQSKI